MMNSVERIAVPMGTMAVAAVTQAPLAADGGADFVAVLDTEPPADMASASEKPLAFDKAQGSVPAPHRPLHGKSTATLQPLLAAREALADAGEGGEPQIALAEAAPPDLAEAAETSGQGGADAPGAALVVVVASPSPLPAVSVPAVSVPAVSVPAQPPPDSEEAFAPADEPVQTEPLAPLAARSGQTPTRVEPEAEVLAADPQTDPEKALGFGQNPPATPAIQGGPSAPGQAEPSVRTAPLSKSAAKQAAGEKSPESALPEVVSPGAEPAKVATSPSGTDGSHLKEVPQGSDPRASAQALPQQAALPSAVEHGPGAQQSAPVQTRAEAAPANAPLDPTTPEPVPAASGSVQTTAPDSAGPLAQGQGARASAVPPAKGPNAEALGRLTLPDASSPASDGQAAPAIAPQIAPQGASSVESLSQAKAPEAAIGEVSKEPAAAPQASSPALPRVQQGYQAARLALGAAPSRTMAEGAKPVPQGWVSADDAPKAAEAWPAPGAQTPDPQSPEASRFAPSIAPGQPDTALAEEFSRSVQPMTAAQISDPQAVEAAEPEAIAPEATPDAAPAAGSRVAPPLQVGPLAAPAPSDAAPIGPVAFDSSDPFKGTPAAQDPAPNTSVDVPSKAGFAAPAPSLPAAQLPDEPSLSEPIPAAPPLAAPALTGSQEPETAVSLQPAVVEAATDSRAPAPVAQAPLSAFRPAPPAALRAGQDTASPQSPDLPPLADPGPRRRDPVAAAQGGPSPLVGPSRSIATGLIASGNPPGGEVPADTDPVAKGQADPQPVSRQGETRRLLQALRQADLRPLDGGPQIASQPTSPHSAPVLTGQDTPLPSVLAPVGSGPGPMGPADLTLAGADRPLATPSIPSPAPGVATGLTPPETLLRAEAPGKEALRKADPRARSQPVAAEPMPSLSNESPPTAAMAQLSGAETPSRPQRQAGAKPSRPLAETAAQDPQAPREVAPQEKVPELVDAPRLDAPRLDAPRLAAQGPNLPGDPPPPPPQHPAQAAPVSSAAGVVQAAQQTAALQTAARQTETTRKAAETARDFAPRLVKRMTETGARKSEIVLEPAELGKLRFELVTRGDKVEVHMTAERPETLDLLRNHVAELRQEFRSAGLDAGAMNFGQWGQGPREDRGTFAPASQTDAGFDPFDQTQPTPAPEHRPVSSGLDLRL